MEQLLELLQGASNPISAIIVLFRAGLWVIFFPLFVWMSEIVWKQWVTTKFVMSREFVLLAVDVPRNNEQSMKAVEQIMAQLHAVFYSPNFQERWWYGVLTDKFSFEIVSIDGYIQYFIHCQTKNVELVKGAFYAQYPDAEIIEVEDYVPNVPQEYPNETHDLLGTEFVLRMPDPYPLKTYEQFEHSLTGVYADPLAAILEMMSRARPGEQVWLQFVVTPIGEEFREKGLQEVEKLIGKKSGSDATRWDKILHSPLHGLELLHESIFQTGGEYSTVPGDSEGQDGNFMNMTTGEKVIVEEIQKKISRLPFRCKIRYIYVAKNEIFDPMRLTTGVYGALKQFNAVDLNGLRFGGNTLTVNPLWLFVEYRRNWRKKSIIMGYAGRNDWAGEPLQTLSHVEIASLFHFPTTAAVATPIFSQTGAKKSEPPTSLPAELPVEPPDLSVNTETDPFSPAEPGAQPSADVPVTVGPVPMPPPPPLAPGQERPSAPQLPPSPLKAGQTQERVLHSMPGLPPGVKPKHSEDAPKLPPSPVAPPESIAPSPPSVTDHAAAISRAPQIRVQGPADVPAQSQQPPAAPHGSAEESSGTPGGAPPNLPIA